MGISKKTITTYKCDRCGRETDDKGDTRANEQGSIILRGDGSIGAKAYDGAWGSTNISFDYWLCLDCTKEFLKFMGGK